MKAATQLFIISYGGTFSSGHIRPGRGTTMTTDTSPLDTAPTVADGQEISRNVSTTINTLGTLDQKQPDPKSGYERGSEVGGVDGLSEEGRK